LRDYLFTDKPVVAREEELDKSENAVPVTASDDGSLGIGSLRKPVDR